MFLCLLPRCFPSGLLVVDSRLRMGQCVPPPSPSRFSPMTTSSREPERPFSRDQLTCAKCRHSSADFRPPEKTFTFCRFETTVQSTIGCRLLYPVGDHPAQAAHRCLPQNSHCQPAGETCEPPIPSRLIGVFFFCRSELSGSFLPLWDRLKACCSDAHRPAPFSPTRQTFPYTCTVPPRE